MQFKKFDGTSIKDLGEYIRGFVETAYDEGHEVDIMVGCDSKVGKRFINYATVICLHKVGKGAHVIFKKDRFKKNGDLKTFHNRMWKEVDLAYEASIYCSEKLNEYNIGLDMTVHIDFNSRKGAKTNDSGLYDQAKGLFTGAGFNFEGKPSAAAASFAADSFCQ